MSSEAVLASLKMQSLMPAEWASLRLYCRLSLVYQFCNHKCYKQTINKHNFAFCKQDVHILKLAASSCFQAGKIECGSLICFMTQVFLEPVKGSGPFTCWLCGLAATIGLHSVSINEQIVLTDCVGEDVVQVVGVVVWIPSHVLMMLWHC